MAVIKSLYKDFDAMFAEMHVDTIPFKVFGKEYQIKKEMPADIVIEMARKEDDDNLSPKFLYRVGLKIFGKEIMDEIMANPGFSTEMLNSMIQWAFQVINGKADADGKPLTEDDSSTEQDQAKN